MSAVRTLFFAKRVPGQPAPYDTLQVSVLYPAKPGAGEQERQHGVVAADPAGAPYPVVVFLNGVGWRWMHHMIGSDQ